MKLYLEIFTEELLRLNQLFIYSNSLFITAGSRRDTAPVEIFNVSEIIPLFLIY